MEMKGDFLSFSFAGKDSSELNIIRTSDGDRFDEQVIPEIKDITAEVPGMDGEYFFGSTYGPRTFDISIAYNSLTESQFRELRQIYGRRRIGELILSERPYKKYMVKIESPIELSYICFDERTYTDDGSRGTGIKDRELRTLSDTTSRIYKGEGKISFVAYYPFAKSCFKVLDTNELKNSDWAISSGILTDTERQNKKVDRYENGQFVIYNAGDIETGFRLYIPMAAAKQGLTLTYEYSAASLTDPLPQLVIKPIEEKTYGTAYTEVDNPTGNPQAQGWYEFNNYNYVLTEDSVIQDSKEYYIKEEAIDSGILIDTNNGLIVGIKSIGTNQDGNTIYETSGNLYNEYIASGYFFQFQPDGRNAVSVLHITGNAAGSEIFYDYLYF